MAGIIPKEKIDNLMNKIEHAPSKIHTSRLFSSDQVNLLREIYQKHEDADYRGAPEGVTRGEADEIEYEVSTRNPSPSARKMLQSHNVHGQFNKEQMDYLDELHEEALK